jgi:hypothetical protein
LDNHILVVKSCEQSIIKRFKKALKIFSEYEKKPTTTADALQDYAIKSGTSIIEGVAEGEVLHEEPV